MTPQDAQARLSALVSTVTVASSPATIQNVQSQLASLAASLPPTPDFDRVADAITAVTQQLRQQLTGAVLTDLNSRTALLGAAVDALAKVSSDAASDARVLSFEQPKLIVAGLTNGIALVQQLQAAVKRQDIAAVQQNAEALLAILGKLQETVRAT